MDYDLNRLGPREFEHLIQALSLKVLGSGVEVFGDGSDGGREATFEGPLDFPRPDPNGVWDGYGVIQAKFHLRPKDTTDNEKWLAGELKKEFAEWLKPTSKRVRRPEYFLGATNVVLSAVPEKGGVDSISKLMDENASPLGLKGWKIWHYDQICRFLDDEDGIAAKYAGLITPGDVLARLHEYVKGMTPDLAGVLTAHVAKDLLTEQLVRLGQAGEANDQGLALNKVAIDLPATIGEEAQRDVSVAAHVISRGNEILRGTDSNGLVVLGGPGQGKTTLAQLICQTYRVALLADLPDYRLMAAVRTLRDEFRGAFLGEVGLELPASRRWPVHIRLDQYSDAIAADSNLTLLRYIAARVTKRAMANITEAQLAEWLRKWPWLLVLDGWDEVADQRTREVLMRHVQEFQVDAGLMEADLLIVVTTRPQGYGGEFDPGCYEHLNLRPLEAVEAIRYAERLAAAQYPVDLDKQEQVLARLRAAAGEDRTARLMRSPLQVTIMSLLLERRPRAPEHRYELFREYYNVLFAREVGKRTADARLLSRHEDHIHALQDAAGLVLQMRSERHGDAEAALPPGDLRALAVHLLMEEDYNPDTADDLSGKLVTLATHRLVMLGPKPDGGIGFDVRSLQEFMAARALITGPDTDILANLTALVPSAHWRNTWLLAAGKLFAERSHLRSELLLQLLAADTVDPLHRSVVPGAHLLVDLLDDRIADTSPKYQTLLVQKAVDQLLKKTPDLYLVRLSEVLAEAMAENGAAFNVVEQAIGDAVASAGPSTVTAMMLCAAWSASTGDLAQTARGWLGEALTSLRGSGDERWAAAVALAANYPLSTLRGLSPVASGRSEPFSMEGLLAPLLAAEGLSHEEEELAGQALTILSRANVWWEQVNGVRVLRTDRTYVPDLSGLDGPLANRRVVTALVRAVDNVGLARWPVASLLRRILGSWLERRPAADLMPMPPISDHGWSR